MRLSVPPCYLHSAQEKSTAAAPLSCRCVKQNADLPAAYLLDGSQIRADMKGLAAKLSLFTAAQPYFSIVLSNSNAVAAMERLANSFESVSLRCARLVFLTST